MKESFSGFVKYYRKKYRFIEMGERERAIKPRFFRPGSSHKKISKMVKIELAKL